jgi:hypothetical protein
MIIKRLKNQILPVRREGDYCIQGFKDGLFQKINRCFALSDQLPLRGYPDQ